MSACLKKLRMLKTTCLAAISSSFPRNGFSTFVPLRRFNHGEDPTLKTSQITGTCDSPHRNRISPE